MTIAEESAARRVVGGVDTHKDLHVAAVVDDQDRVLATHCFATTRQGYRARCRTAGWRPEWGDVLRSLDRLQEVTISKDGREMTLRTPATGLTGPLFKAARIALPPNVREAGAV